MKISYADYIKKSPASVLVAEAIFFELERKYPCFAIENVAETSSGGTPLRGNIDFYNGDIPWLKSGELNDGFIDAAEEFITEKGLKNSSAKLFDEGTLLIAMYGATAGKTGITKIKAATNQAVCAVFPKNTIRRDFLFWFFRSHRFKFIEKSKGGAQPNISQSLILKTKVPVPDLEVQDEVISLLNNIDQGENIDLSIIPVEFRGSVKFVLFTKNSCTGIDSELTHQLSLVKQLRQAFLREAMQGKLVKQNPADGHAKDLLAQIKAEKASILQAQGKKEKPLPPIRPEEIPFEIPEGWVWCRLGEVCTLITDGKHGDANNQSNSGYYFLSAKDIQNGKFLYEGARQITYADFIETHRRTNLEPGDLCIVNTGATIGKTAFAPENELTYRTTFQKSVAVIKVIKSLTSMKFIEFFIINETPKLLKVSRGSAINNLLLGDLKNVLIPFPPLQEQYRIVEQIEKILQKCEDLAYSIVEGKTETEQLLKQVLREAVD